MRQHIKRAPQILLALFAFMVLVWAGSRVWSAFSPKPKPQQVSHIDEEATASQALLERTQKVSVVALSDEQFDRISSELDRLLKQLGVFTPGLGEAVTRRLTVLFSGSWEEYVSYVRDVSTFADRANLTLRDKTQWAGSITYWSQSSVSTEGLGVRITWRNGQEMPIDVHGGYAHRKDDGLYSAVDQLAPKEIIVQADIPVRILEPMELKSEIDAVLVMEFAQVGQRWVPWRTGLRFPGGYDGPVLVPWL